LDLYEQNKGTEDEDIYFLNLLAAQISVIPGVIMPLAILTLPFRIITSPIRIAGAFGRWLRESARGMAKKTRSKLSKEPSLVEASSKLGKAKIATKGVQTVKTAAKAVLDTSKKIAKPLATGAKIATVAAVGDIPQKIKDWQKSGEEFMKNMKQPERTLGKFPRFNELSTQ